MGKEIENSKLSERMFSFKKEERLCSKKVIDKLFAEGTSFLSFPLKVVYTETKLPSKWPVQAAFSVGKRNFKLAVHRNKIKRKVREAYRLNKSILYNGIEGKQVAVFFVFIGKSIPEFKQVEIAMKKGLERIKKEIAANDKELNEL